MEERGIETSLAFKVSTITILTAITAVFTLAVRIPVAPTRGYINLGDVAIYFSALTFGPLTALIAGGLGTALADIIGGYAQYAPITFIAHGFQGFVIGLIVRGLLIRKKDEIAIDKGKRLDFIGLVLAFMSGTIVMAGVYLLAEAFMVGLGAALAELPGNIIQNVAGIAGGIPLTLAIRKAYPPILNFRW